MNVERIPVFREKTTYWDTDELLRAIGLDSPPDGPVRTGERPEVERPTNRTEDKRRAG